MSAVAVNTSLYIPHIFANFSKEFVAGVFEKLQIGKVKNIDFVLKVNSQGKEYNAAYIHFEYWNDTIASRNFHSRVVDSKDEARIVYDEPWFWVVLENKARKYTPGERKPRIQLDDPVQKVAYIPQEVTAATIEMEVEEDSPSVHEEEIKLAEPKEEDNDDNASYDSYRERINRMEMSDDEVSVGSGYGDDAWVNEQADEEDDDNASYNSHIAKLRMMQKSDVSYVYDHCDYRNQEEEEQAAELQMMGEEEDNMEWIQKVIEENCMMEVDEEIEEDERNLDEIADAIEEVETQMIEVEAKMDQEEEDQDMIYIDGRYVQTLEQENNTLRQESYALRLQLQQYADMYNKELIKTQALVEVIQAIKK
jgi:hypothetical protein